MIDHGDYCNNGMIHERFRMNVSSRINDSGTVDEG